MDQIIIKIALISSFGLLTFVLIRSGRTQRGQALRTFGYGIFLLIAIIAITFPATVDGIAVLIGVGRGADLLLYVFVVVFIGQSLAAHRRRRAQDEMITALARKIALLSPEYPKQGIR